MNPMMVHQVSILTRQSSSPDTSMSGIAPVLDEIDSLSGADFPSPDPIANDDSAVIPTSALRILKSTTIVMMRLILVRPKMMVRMVRRRVIVMSLHFFGQLMTRRISWILGTLRWKGIVGWRS